MRAFLQRVTGASVTVEGRTTGKIGPGLLVLLGAGQGDCEETCALMLEKILSLRIFEDEKGKMNLSLRDTGGSLLLVSQFTLFADTGKGNRPGFSGAMPAGPALNLYKHFVEQARLRLGDRLATGLFGANMQVSLVNDGPVSLMLEIEP